MAAQLVVKTAIWCSPHAWRSASQVGAHHLSRRLAERNWKVLFLSNPVSPLHLLGWQDSEIRSRLRAAQRGITGEAPNLTSFLPLTLLPFAGGIGAASSWMLAHWPHWTLPPLFPILREQGFMSPDLMVIDGPVAAPLVSLVQPRRSVLRILDRLSGFQGHGPAISAAETALAKLVDCVTYSAADLAGHTRQLGARRVLHLPNGVDAKAFAIPHPEPPAYRSLRRPRIVYAGTMAEWFDYGLVERVARSRPDWEIVLIGPEKHARRRLPSLHNLHLLGSIAWADLPGYLQHADAGIIPFNVAAHGDLIHSINPLKLYEYAAAGLPTISVSWRELISLQAPAALVDSPENFVSVIDATLAAPPDPQSLRDFSARHDWNNTLDRLLATVS